MLLGNLPHGQAFFVAFVTCCLKGAVMICDMNCLTTLSFETIEVIYFGVVNIRRIVATLSFDIYVIGCFRKF